MQKLVVEGVDPIMAGEEKNSILLASKLVTIAMMLNAHLQALSNTEQRNKSV